MTSLAPAAANASAITRPRPLEPPVTRTILSLQKLMADTIPGKDGENRAVRRSCSITLGAKYPHAVNQ